MTLFAIADTAGRLADLTFAPSLADAFAPAPAIDECWLFFHGWCTRMIGFVQNANQFSSGILPHIGRSATRLSVGLHWPSTLCEDTSLPASFADLGTYFCMEARADTVGKNAAADIIRSVVRNQRGPIKLKLVGHSFGCKVVCAALQKLAEESFDFSQVDLRVVLLQAAFESDALEPGKRYGSVCKLPVKILATKSELDRALVEWFPRAALIGDPLGIIAHHDRQALGGVGPTPTVRQAFGSKLSMADLTPVHKERQAMFRSASGSHSDYLNLPVYELVAQA